MPKKPKMILFARGIVNMKRFVLFLIITAILLVAAGCDNEKHNSTSDNNNLMLEPSKPDAKNEPKETINPIEKVQSQNDTNNENNDSGPEAKDISSLIPSGWHILTKNDDELAKVEGDLNNDGIDDIAFVIECNSQQEQPKPEMVSAPPRSLLIAFGNKDNIYSLSIKADNAIMLRDQGGVYGDPFDDIEIDKGTVLLKFYGGSNWRWYNNYRFRFQDEGWYLIGATFGSYYSGTTTMDNADEEDYNLLTGDYIIRKSDEKGKLVTTKGNRGKRELLNLKDFVAGIDASEY